MLVLAGFPSIGVANHHYYSSQSTRDPAEQSQLRYSIKISNRTFPVFDRTFPVFDRTFPVFDRTLPVFQNYAGKSWILSCLRPVVWPNVDSKRCGVYHLYSHIEAT